MASLATISYQIGFRGIERAYRESRRTFENEIADWTARYVEYEVDRAATGAEHEDVWNPDYGAYVGDQIFEAERSLGLVREAFAIILYHFWEKEARSLLGIEDLRPTTVREAVLRDGRFTLDGPGLARLRAIVNCVKHGGGEELHALDPGMFDPDWIPKEPKAAGWHYALRLKDSDLDAAFVAVRSSGPRTRPAAVEGADIAIDC